MTAINYDDPTAVGQLIDTIEIQQELLQFASFTNDDAIRLGNILVRLAQERGYPISIDIHRGDAQLFFASLNGSIPDREHWLTRKRAAVMRFGESSYLVGLRYRIKGELIEDVPTLDPNVYAGHGGCFPITVIGVGIIGTVGVSGLAQDEDHDLAVEAVSKFLGRSAIEPMDK